jgi:SAM-dependent methyltransferase
MRAVTPLIALWLAAAAALPQAPFLATPADVVDRMLAMAGITASDVVYDLGCGDGRIVIAAARKYGARGVGIDIDPARIDEARRNAHAAGVENLVTFRVEDALTTDVSAASVVTLYLVASLNARLRPRLMAQLAPGARIVSHNFPIGDWEPDRVETFTSADAQTRTLFRWDIR